VVTTARRASSSLRPGVPAALDTVVATALAKREDDRYLTAAEMADDLDEVLTGGTPRYAGAAMSSAARVRPSGEDALLDGLVATTRGTARASAHDPAAVAALLDEATRSIPRPQAAATLASVSPPMSGRRWLAPAGGRLRPRCWPPLCSFAWPRPAPVEPSPEPVGAPSALPSLKAISPGVFLGAGASPAARSAPPVIVEVPPANSAPPASMEAAPGARPTTRPAAEPPRPKSSPRRRTLR
jgi:serine/threonine-protein kinase